MEQNSFKKFINDSFDINNSSHNNLNLLQSNRDTENNNNSMHTNISPENNNSTNINYEINTSTINNSNNIKVLPENSMLIFSLPLFFRYQFFAECEEVNVSSNIRGIWGQ